jgi:hypothetical protein
MDHADDPNMVGFDTVHDPVLVDKVLAPLMITKRWDHASCVREGAASNSLCFDCPQNGLCATRKERTRSNCVAMSAMSV